MCENCKDSFLANLSLLGRGVLYHLVGWLAEPRQLPCSPRAHSCSVHPEGYWKGCSFLGFAVHFTVCCSSVVLRKCVSAGLTSQITQTDVFATALQLWLRAGQQGLGFWHVPTMCYRLLVCLSRLRLNLWSRFVCGNRIYKVLLMSQVGAVKHFFTVFSAVSFPSH